MGWVNPRVGLGWIGLGRDFLIFGGLGWVVGPKRQKHKNKKKSLYALNSLGVACWHCVNLAKLLLTNLLPLVPY